MIETFLSQFPPFEFNAFWVSQILIGFALISDLISWQCKNRKWILSFLVISCILIATHYVLLKELTGAVLLYIAALRYLVSIFTIKKTWMWFFLFLVAAGAYVSYESPKDIIELIANSVWGIAAFQVKDKNLREQTMIGSVFHIIYNVLVLSPAAIVLEIFFLFSNIVGYWRFYLRKK